MNFTFLIRSAWRTLKSHLIRSILTVLGITIGIAAIIVTFSIGRGAEIKIRSQIVSMGEGAMYIVPGNVLERGITGIGTSREARITEQDLKAIVEQTPTVVAASRGHDDLANLQYGAQIINERVIGADESFREIADYPIKWGTFFNNLHVASRTNVAVLGKELAQKLFKDEYPIGQTMLIDRVPFTVIGVFGAIDFYQGTNDPNARAYIPFSAADKYFRKKDFSPGDLSFIVLKAENEYPAQTLRMVKRILRLKHGIKQNESDDFMIFDQESISAVAEEAARILKLFGLIAASIALVVGGIGIMNIMLVSVKERTREIGIRLAIGATQNSIQTQFLFEAVTLCLFGGLLGLMLGLSAQHIISTTAELPTVIEQKPLIFSFLATIMIGIFFGYYPAYKASLLNPVDALLER